MARLTCCCRFVVVRGYGWDVDDYIWKIEDPDPLAALMFNYQAQADTIPRCGFAAPYLQWP